MASTYTWRATDGKYFSSSGSSSTIDNHVYYSSNRAFRMDYPDLGRLLGKDKRTLSIQSAILHVYITEAHSATLTIGYSYGDFGDYTDLALRAFQKSAKLEANGECDKVTLAALEKAVAALQSSGCDGDSCPINVWIVGGNCYVRTAPNTEGVILGVAHKGDTLSYGGEVSAGGWLRVQYKEQDAWVSGKYGTVE